VLALSEDKRRVKQLLDTGGVPTPRWRIYDTARPDDWQALPAIVQAALEHCSLGVTPEAVVLTLTNCSVASNTCWTRFTSPRWTRIY